MTFRERQRDRRKRSLRRIATEGLRQRIARLDERLRNLNGETPDGPSALDLWVRALGIVCSALLRLEVLLARAERQNERVRAKRAMLSDEAAREEVLERLGGEAALLRWQHMADAIARRDESATLHDEASEATVGMVMELVPGQESAISERDARTGFYKGDAGFRLPCLPRPKARRTGRRHGRDARRNFMAGIPVWPDEFIREPIRPRGRPREWRDAGTGRARLRNTGCNEDIRPMARDGP